MSKKFIFGGSYSGFAYEQETIDYLTAISIPNDNNVIAPPFSNNKTGNEIWNAINDFFISGKNSTWYSKLDALYLPVWGSASKNKFNIINPIDNASAFVLSFSGGWTHNEFGILQNGLNCYADGSFIPLTVYGSNFNSFGSYYGQTFTSGHVNIHGCADNTINLNISNIGYNNGAISCFVSNQSNTQTIFAETDNKGFVLTTRQGSSLVKVFRNGALINSNTIASSSNPNKPFLWGARYAGQINKIEYFSNTQQLRLMYNSSSLSDTEVSEFNTAVTTLLTDLSINV